MKVVYKYTLMTGAGAHLYLEHDLPQGAQILCVKEQHGDLVLYALVDPGRPTVKRQFFLVGTGNGLAGAPKGYKYIGTTLHLNHALVLHTFEAFPPPPEEGAADAAD